jgi:hypothetical protein
MKKESAMRDEDIEKIINAVESDLAFSQPNELYEIRVDVLRRIIRAWQFERRPRPQSAGPPELERDHYGS